MPTGRAAYESPDVVESLSGDVLRVPSKVDVSRSEDGVSGALDVEGERKKLGSRYDMEGRRSLSVSPPGGDRTAGQSDLSLGNARPWVGSR